MFTRSRAILILLAFLAFGNAVRGSFHFDDYSLFSANPPITDLFRLETTRPLTWLTFWMNRQLAGDAPLSWHLIDFGLHLANVLLLLACLQRVTNNRIALVAAAIFAIHPIQTEAVAYVFARSTLLMTLLCLLAWRDWLNDHRRRAILWFALALLAKEECVFFPVFLLLFDRKRREAYAMLALSLLAGLRTIAATQAVQGSGAGFGAGISPAQYALAQGAVIWRYLGQLAIPVNFTIDPDPHPPVWLGIIGWLGVVAAFRYGPIYVRGGIVLLLASSSIFPAADLAADRRMYLPLIAFAIAIANKLPHRLGPILLLLIPLSIVRTEVWRTERNLWEDAVAKAPAKTRPRIQLARALPPDQALNQLIADDPDTQAERGRIYLQTNRAAEALSEFGKVAAARPKDAQAWNNLGVAFAQLEQSVPAQQNFRKALLLDPCNKDARKNLGLPACER